MVFRALVVVLVWGLALTQPYKLVEEVWTVKLAGCYLDYHVSIQAVALACPGVNYLRLWPLSVTQPWWDPTNTGPDWLPGGYARR